MQINNDQFVNGQQSYARGIGLRTIMDQAVNIADDDLATSLVLGYLDGVCASIRRIDNLLLFPAGPEK